MFTQQQHRLQRLQEPPTHAKADPVVTPKTARLNAPTRKSFFMMGVTVS
jgi:hypothetical protein